MSIELRPEHGFVLATAVGAVAIHHIWMSLKVGKARKAFGVAYPTLYAPPGHKHENEYNCVQRAHQNSLENLSTFYALLLTAGIKYPISASVAGAVYLLGRIMYFKGYCEAAEKRTRGGFLHLGELGLLGMVARWAVELIAKM